MEVVTKSKKHYTYQEYLSFPDDEQWEIIFGEAYMVPAPYIKHQDLSRNLGTLLVNYVREKTLGKTYYAPTDVVLNEETIVQPDLLFISKERLNIITEKNIQGPPDLIIEILSNDPKSIIRDRREKKKAYEESGVKEYIIVDYTEKYVEHYFLVEGKYQEIGVYGEEEKFQLKTIEGLIINLHEVFT